MKKYKILYLIIVMPFLFSSCEDYLDKKDPNSELVTEEQIFTDQNIIVDYSKKLYDCTSWVFEGRYRDRHGATMGSGKNYFGINYAAGEVSSTRSIEVNKIVARGDWQAAVQNHYANPEWRYSWADSWEAIYMANLLLDKLPEIYDVLPNYLAKQIHAEAFGFKAFAYYSIMQRWGSVPYFKDRLTATTNLDVPFTPYDTLVNRIVADCDSAIRLSPKVSYLDDPENMGRIGKAGFMALKSRVLTTAASPLNNPGNDLSKWERAAEAAWEVIELSQTEAQIGLYQGERNDIFWGVAGTIEGLWPRYYQAENYKVYMMHGLWKSNGKDEGSALGCSPTLELVDKYETADGWPVNDSRSAYTDDLPYDNRDPRFYKDFLYHGCTWTTHIMNDTIDVRTYIAPENRPEGREEIPYGDDRQPPGDPDHGNSETGFLLRKYLPENWNRVFPNKVQINMPMIRMAEMYLNYSEAVNEAYMDPNSSFPGASLTSVEALNVIRNRAGQVDVRSEFTSDYLVFRDRIRNEFGVELSLEYHHWHDLIRWKIAHEVLHGKKFTGFLISDDDTKPMGLRFERFAIDYPAERVFEERNYRYPFRTDDLEKLLNFNLNQNPGW